MQCKLCQQQGELHLPRVLAHMIETSDGKDATSTSEFLITTAGATAADTTGKDIYESVIVDYDSGLVVPAPLAEAETTNMNREKVLTVAVYHWDKILLHKRVDSLPSWDLLLRFLIIFRRVLRVGITEWCWITRAISLRACCPYPLPKMHVHDAHTG